MKTIVYFGENSAPALTRVSHLRALNGDDAAQAIAAIAFAGERIKADEIEFMPDVPGWHRSRIEKHFQWQKDQDAKRDAEEASRRNPSAPRIESEDDFRRSMTSRVPAPDAGHGDTEDAQRDPLDHDGDGAPGGSLPAAERGLDELKAAYEAKFGRAPDKRWGEKRLLKELGE